MMLRWVLLAALLAQVPTLDSVDKVAEAELERDRLRLRDRGPKSGIFTIIARFGDGQPARGYISCDGMWCKYGGGEPVPGEIEPDYCAQNLPFKTDSRGACVFNPPLYWMNDDENGWMTCHATSGLRSGKLSFTPYNGGVYIITIPGVRP